MTQKKAKRKKTTALAVVVPPDQLSRRQRRELRSNPKKSTKSLPTGEASANSRRVGGALY